MKAQQEPAPSGDDPAASLGARLRRARLEAQLSARELARHLGVSASFVSQIENGKSQPSVATLYSMAQFLGVSMDQLFEEREHVAAPAGAPPTLRIRRNERQMPPTPPSNAPADQTFTISRGQLDSPSSAWGKHPSDHVRFLVTAPDNRTRLVMDSGVVWEQLVRKTDQLDFMEILYPPGSSSTTDGRMLRHDDYEYGILLEGELEITVGFDVFTLHAGEAIGFDSSIPHLFRNLGATPARGIWVVHHRHQ
ncbi:MAG: helix-turn-helix domain-containing protein [Pseudonocardia sp.]|nr:helix-turn-helix domain-containing protein [Pseudonocardia sp.]